MDFCDGFIRGYNDCSEGVPHKNGTDAYNRGYNTQYESQVIAEKHSQIDIWSRA